MTFFFREATWSILKTSRRLHVSINVSSHKSFYSLCIVLAHVCRRRNLSHIFCLALIHDSVQVRRALQARNYKKGRVSQLVRLTRPDVESTQKQEQASSSSGRSSVCCKKWQRRRG